MTHVIPTLARSPGHRPIAALLAHLREWRDRAREREFLAQMSERDLRDIRLTRMDAEREAAKPFWRR